MKLSAIVCLDMYGGMGKDGRIPWVDENGKNEYPSDFKHFQNVTKDKTLIMGRRTYEEIESITLKRAKKPKALLPKRESIVVSRNPDYKPKLATKYENWRLALYDHKEEDEVFIIGGAQLFLETLPFIETAYITIIDKDYQCNKQFQIDYLRKNFKIVDGRQEKDLYFVTYERVR